MQELDKWLEQETWHTPHPLDEERFNHGVRKLLANSNENPTGQDVLHYIEDKIGIDESHQHHKYAVGYATRYEAIDSFIADNHIEL